MQRTILAAVVFSVAACGGAGVGETTFSTVAETTTSAPTTTTSVPTTETTNTTTTTVALQPAVGPILVNEGYWTYQTFEGAAWVAIIENPNTDWVLTNVVFAVTVFDQTGRAIDTDYVTTTFILPNAQVAISGHEIEQPEAITSLKLRSSWDSQPASDAPPGGWFATDITVTQEIPGLTAFTGSIRSTFTEVVRMLTVTVVLFDSAGSPIGSAQAIRDVSADQETVFAVEMSDRANNPPHEYFEVFFTPGLVYSE